MVEKLDSLDDLSPEQLTALVELAEDYQSGRVTRRDILTSAGAGGIAGLVGGVGYSALVDSESSPSNGPGSGGNNNQTPGNPTTTPNGNVASIVAAPGEVQQAIEFAASRGGGMVSLDPTRKYQQPSSPWDLKEHVILDFNGAILYGTGDSPNTDIIQVYPGAQVHNPRIDLYNDGEGYTGSNGYQGRVFTLDTQWGPYFADGTRIRNGHIAAVGDSGTACYLGVTESGNYITHLDIEFDVGVPKGSSADATLATAVDMDTSGAGDDGWINGVHISGHWRYVDTGVLQRGAVGKFNQQNFNFFEVQLQSSDSANAYWQIRDPTWARLNSWWGMVWDLGGYEGAAWKIDSEYQDSEDPWRGCKLNSVFTPAIAPSQPKNVRNRSPNTHYVNRMFDLTTHEF